MYAEWGLTPAVGSIDDGPMRVEAGAVVDEYEMAGIGQVVARYSRMTTPEGVSWKCMFTVVASGVADLALVHRLVAPTLSEARRCVRHAVEFLAGRGPDPVQVAAQQPATRSDVTEQPPAPWSADPRGNQSRTPTFRLPMAPEPAPLG
jgi:hypothetical protein